MDLGKIFLSNLTQKICTGFVFKGKECTCWHGQWFFACPAWPLDLSQDDLNSIIGKFWADKMSWLNMQV